MKVGDRGLGGVELKGEGGEALLEQIQSTEDLFRLT